MKIFKTHINSEIYITDDPSTVNNNLEIIQVVYEDGVWGIETCDSGLLTNDEDDWIR